MMAEVQSASNNRRINVFKITYESYKLSDHQQKRREILVRAKFFNTNGLNIWRGKKKKEKKKSVCVLE
jgi:hypothetical protein